MFIPIGIIGYVIYLIASWVSPKLQIFTSFVPDGEFDHNPFWWRLLSILISLFLLWLFGKKGKNLNKFLDKHLSKVWVVGRLYKFVNGIIESLEDTVTRAKIAGATGSIVFLPLYNDGYPQVAFIMNNKEVMLYSPKYKEILPHLSVNFGSLPPFKGGPTTFVTVKEINESRSKNPKLNFEDAVQFNVSNGITLTEAFFQKCDEEKN